MTKSSSNGIPNIFEATFNLSVKESSNLLGVGFPLGVVMNYNYLSSTISNCLTKITRGRNVVFF